MFTFTPAISTFLRDCVWQSTLWLALGGLVSMIWKHWPARAHCVMLLALLGCLTTPFLSSIVRQSGWALLSRSESGRAGRNDSDNSLGYSPRSAGSGVPATTEPAEKALATPSSLPAALASPRTIPDRGSKLWPSESSISWLALLGSLWMILSASVVFKLTLSAARELSILRRVQALTNPEVQQALEQILVKLNLTGTSLRVCVSDRIRCPVIFCWFRRPTLVLPRSITTTSKGLTGVFGHELAHWKRRDHWAALVGELALCFLPWHPAVWWAKRRLEHLAELACDQWVLASGQSPDTYAESLLGLVPHRRAALALPAVKHRSKLEDRIRWILRESRTDPKPGSKWTSLATVAWVCLAVVLALFQAQTRAEGGTTDADKDDKKDAKVAASKLPGGRTMVFKRNDLSEDPQKSDDSERFKWNKRDGGNDHTYEIVTVPERISWDVARARAEAKGGHLASITSIEELAFVIRHVRQRRFWQEINQKPYNYCGPWLGGYQEDGADEPRGGWKWITGERLEWFIGAPENYWPGRNENRLGFYYRGGDNALTDESITTMNPTWTDLTPEPFLGQVNSYLIEWDYDNMVWVSPGTFTMGSPETEPDRDSDEGPQTEVTLSKGFYMGKHEVTQGEYQSVMGTNPSSRKGAANLPVEQVSWTDATNYCGKLTKSDRMAGRLPAGYEYRLPTEAEWEYACRAGMTTATPYGDSLSSTLANFDGNHPYHGAAEGPYLGRTAEVGSYAPNAWGLCDMAGNVFEWCLDFYGNSLPGGNVADPDGPSSGWNRVVRGGGWYVNGRGCRSADRIFCTQDGKGNNIGFRVVLATCQP